MAPPSPSSTNIPNEMIQDKGEITIYPVLSYSPGEIKDSNGSKLPEEATDDAARYLSDTRAELFQPLTPEREKRLRKKIDSWMIPLVHIDPCRSVPLGPMPQLHSSSHDAAFVYRDARRGRQGRNRNCLALRLPRRQ